MVSNKVPIFQSDQASYAAIAAYIALEHMDFAGDWLLQLAALFVFFYARFERYRNASDKQKRRYSALFAGYIVFSILPLVLLTFTAQLQLRAPLPNPWVLNHLDTIYIIPAAFYLSVVDQMKEPNKSPEPTPTSVTSPAAQEPRQP